jgi:gliding motility-associated-like protein
MGNDECPGVDTTYSQVVVVAPIPIESMFTVAQTGACELLAFEANNESLGENLTYQWSLDGLPLATTEDFSGDVNEPGTYQITLTIFEEACDQTDEYTQDVVLIDQIDLQLQPDMPICYYQEELTIQAAEPGAGATYLWSTGETSSFIEVSGPGVYSVEVNWNNCSGTDTVEVNLIPAMVLTEDVNFCEGSTTFLTIPFDGSAYYSWCNGETEQNITTDQDGQYCYQFIDEVGCIQEGVINVFVQDFNASLYIPNAFTPNNDGINDVFSAKGVDISEFELKIWNRWGDEIFNTTDINEVWTGNVNNTGAHYVQDGVYTYTVSYRGICSSEKIEETGTIVVVR